MPSKVIRIDLEVITELDKLRPFSPSSYSSIILKLLRSHQELAKIEQFAMSGNDSTSAMIKLNHEPIIANKQNHTQISTTPIKPIKPKMTKKPKKQIIEMECNTCGNHAILFCYDCQMQTSQFQLKTKEWKCAICGSKRNV